MKVKDFLNWIKENGGDEESEIDIARYLDKDLVAYGNFYDNDLVYDKDIETVQIWVG